MSWMKSQRIQDMREKDRIFNPVFLLIKMKMFKDQGKEITLMLGQEFNQLQMPDGTLILGMLSLTILGTLIHIRADKINWHQVFLSRPITLSMLPSIKSK